MNSSAEPGTLACTTCMAMQGSEDWYLKVRGAAGIGALCWK